MANNPNFAENSLIYYTMDIKNIVRNRRRELGISQEDLAEMSEVSLATIKNIERGEGNPTFKTVMKVMEILGLEIIFQVRNTLSSS